eukprot:COSAG04_NODE_1734_length_5755_cov_2.998762_6_plen_36_part_00
MPAELLIDDELSRGARKKKDHGSGEQKTVSVSARK